jgi:protein involved in polysaccharide export with SLBB domain
MTSEQVETAPLLPGDSVVIPVEVGYVKVSGSVMRPGIYPYVRGKPIGFYLGLSGRPLANEKDLLVSVVDRISGLSSERAMDGPVLDGDEIVIRRREQEQ